MTTPGTPVVTRKPTVAFIGAAWTALIVAILTYCVALWRMPLTDDQRWFFGAILAFGLFGVVSVVKSVRDREDGIPVTPLFFGLSWIAALAPITAIIIYLLNWNADELQRGFLFLAYMFSVFAAVVVQRNTRDLDDWNKANPARSKPVSISNMKPPTTPSGFPD